MKDAWKTAFYISLFATIFVAATAAWLRNPGLIILAGLSLASTIGLWAKRNSGASDRAAP